MIKVCDGEKVYYLVPKGKKSEAVKLAFELFGNNFSITSATKKDEYGNFLVDRNDGKYWCISKGAEENGRC